MNKLISKFLFFALAIAAFTFTSCGDDDTAEPETCATLGCPDGFTCENDVCVQIVTDCNTTPCPDGFVCENGTCVSATVRVTSNITADATWTANKTYILATRVAVVNGVTLTIEPGTVIKGEAGQGPNATALLVARGGKINACGTADLPIIFTSIADNITGADVAAGNLESPNLNPDVNGLWGGVLLLGKAKISVAGDAVEAQIEGIPTSDPNGLYGGTDDADNSGTLCYVSIRHGGTNIGDGNEINGLTLGGVGSGTSINHIEIVANQDDGVEWFGGTVSVSNLVVWNNGDDAVDTDQAWAGTLDNFVVVGPANSCLELDGPEGTYAAGHKIQNGYVIANTGSEVTLNEFLIDVDGGATATIVDLKNIYVTGIIDNSNTIAGPPSQVPTTTWTNIVLDIPAGDNLADYIDEGVVPAGVTATGASTADLTVFGWTWTKRAGAF
ncbi:MAG: EB domain-containing protein [Saprospiraceae bacterium]